MQNKNVAYRTQTAIALAFEELFAKNSLSKITVKMIADTAKVSKQTFYNYFESIPDLISWIYLSQCKGYEISRVGYPEWAEHSCEIFSEKEKYYLKLFKESEFLLWLGEYVVDQMLLYIQQHFQPGELSEEEARMIHTWVFGGIAASALSVSKGKSIPWKTFLYYDLASVPPQIQKYFPSDKEIKSFS